MANLTKGSGLGTSNGQGYQSIGSMLKETLGRDNADILGSDAEDDQVLQIFYHKQYMSLSFFQNALLIHVA